MARPIKNGLDYFPLDVDFFEDEKIEAISGEFGLKGEIATIKLLCAIYRNGYFILWDELLKMKLLKNLPGISPELLDRIVYRLVLWGFFDKNLFDSVKVLTSKGIQDRFFCATKRRKSSSKDDQYLLIDVDNNLLEKEPKGVIAYSNGVNVYNNPVESELLHAKSTQSKGKERKKKVTTNVVTKKDPAAAIAATQTRAKAFGEALVPFMGLYGKDMIRAFYNFWTEPNKSQTKMRFELEKTWEISRRLATWAKNERIKPKNDGRDKYEQKRIASEQRKLESLASIDAIRADAERRRKELEAEGVVPALPGSVEADG